MNLRYYCVFVLLLSMAVGCTARKAAIESNRTAVTGKVTIDGKALTGGIIMFVSKENPVYRVSIMLRPDGTFRVGDAPKGPVIVTIDTEPLKSGNPANYMPIPNKYTDLKTSGLTADIKAGDTAPLTFDLKSRG